MALTFIALFFRTVQGFNTIGFFNTPFYETPASGPDSDSSRRLEPGLSAEASLQGAHSYIIFQRTNPFLFSYFTGTGDLACRSVNRDCVYILPNSGESCQLFFSRRRNRLVEADASRFFIFFWRVSCAVLKDRDCPFLVPRFPTTRIL